ncbi:hypothetical protein [Allomuricauda sp. F6463D]|uniref:hypothetical protein n=1 Tax=Allomuricauda sp. F6463D TaxID=2926409 RepID=UPI001FF2D884|nr:hypothetical protein [Muricauda sp. F6463D]
MKCQVPLFLILLYLIGLARPIVPLINFAVNQDYIANFLCINSDKPELECNGKCYLMKKLQYQKDHGDQQDSFPEINIYEFPIGLMVITYITSTIIFTMENKTFFGHTENYFYLYSFSDFHPPSVLL